MNIIEAKILAMACKFKLVLEQTREEESRLVHITYDRSVSQEIRDDANYTLKYVEQKLRTLEVLEEIGLGEIAGEWE